MSNQNNVFSYPPNQWWQGIDDIINTLQAYLPTFGWVKFDGHEGDWDRFPLISNIHGTTDQEGRFVHVGQIFNSSWHKVLLTYITIWYT